MQTTILLQNALPLGELIAACNKGRNIDHRLMILALHLPELQLLSVLPDGVSQPKLNRQSPALQNHWTAVAACL